MATDEGVLVVDTQQHPADARRLLGLIRQVADKPVRWVVVTHARLGVRAAPPAHHRQADGALSVRSEER